MWDITNEDEGRKAAEGVEICFGDRLVGSESPSEMATPGVPFSQPIDCRTDQIHHAARSPGHEAMMVPVTFSCWWWVDCCWFFPVWSNPWMEGRFGFCWLAFAGPPVARYATVLPILLRRVRCSICWFVPPQTMCGERDLHKQYWRGVFPSCPRRVCSLCIRERLLSAGRWTGSVAAQPARTACNARTSLGGNGESASVQTDCGIPTRNTRVSQQRLLLMLPCADGRGGQFERNPCPSSPSVAR